MDSADTLPDQAQTEAPKVSRFGPLVLAAQAAGVVAAAFLTSMAVAIFVPDGTDYAEASILKHNLLAADVPKKIVLVGGSNLAFGADSTVIEDVTSCPVVNMGMNGYFGVRFMLEEVKPDLRAGDIVVIAWEYDSFYKSVDGANTDLLMVTKANTDALQFLTPTQKLGVLGRYPYVAQQKIIRLLGDGYEAFAGLFGASEDHSDPTGIGAIESLGGFTPEGDLVSHLGKTWEFDLEDGLDVTNLPLDEDILPMMDAFVREMNTRGVNVMISWTPIIDDYYARHTAEIERLNAQMEEIPSFLIPRPARDFVFPPSQHFDTVYHLNAEGRAIRSKMVADDIVTVFGDDAFCDRQP
ncbi:hypothetical protein HHI_15828 [Hyphomonas hirschiana VP5]|nr:MULTISPECIES: hypothetical protein [Hyphomonas]KCZ87533.1 hypothetical protein HHI_15828 [Hyphomonas hirschiana VP5]